MSVLKIISSDRVSNYNALQAVARWMKENFNENNYAKTRVVMNDDKCLYQVTELQQDEGTSLCSANFEVTEVVT